MSETPQPQQEALPQQESKSLEEARKLMAHVASELSQANAEVEAGKFAEAKARLEKVDKHYTEEDKKLEPGVMDTQEMKAAYDANVRLFRALNGRVNKGLAAATEQAPQQPIANEAPSPDATIATETVNTDAPATDGEVIEGVVTGAEPANSVTTDQVATQNGTTGDRPGGSTLDEIRADNDVIFGDGAGDKMVAELQAQINADQAQGDGAASQTTEAPVADVITESPVADAIPAAPTTDTTQPAESATPGAVANAAEAPAVNPERAALQARVTERVQGTLNRINDRFNNLPADQRATLEQVMVTDMMLRMDRLHATGRPVTTGDERMNIMAAIMGTLHDRNLIPGQQLNWLGNDAFSSLMDQTMNGYYGRNTFNTGDVYTDGRMQYRGGRMIERAGAQHTPTTQPTESATPASNQEQRPAGQVVEQTTAQPERNGRIRGFVRGIQDWWARTGNGAPAAEVLPAIAPTTARTAEAPSVAPAAAEAGATTTPAPTEAATATAAPVATESNPATDVAETNIGELTAEQIAEAIAKNSANRTGENDERKDDGTPPPPEAPAPAAMLARLHEVEGAIKEMPADTIEGISDEQLEQLAEAADILFTLDHDEAFQADATQENFALMDAITQLIRQAYEHQMDYLAQEQDHTYDQRCERIALLVEMTAPAMQPELADSGDADQMDRFIQQIINEKIGPRPRAARQNKDRAEWREKVREVRVRRLDSQQAQREGELKGKTKEYIIRKAMEAVDAIDNAAVIVRTLDIRTQRVLENLEARLETRLDELAASGIEFTNQLAGAGDQLTEGLLVLGADVSTVVEQFIFVDAGEIWDKKWDQSKRWLGTPVRFAAEKVKEFRANRRQKLEKAEQKKAENRAVARSNYQTINTERRRRAETPGAVRTQLQRLRDQ